MTVKPKDRTASDLIELAPQAPDDLYVAVEVCARCGAIVTTCRGTRAVARTDFSCSGTRVNVQRHHSSSRDPSPRRVSPCHARP